jgi:V8-like Glu-specific endopeptidase
MNVLIRLAGKAATGATVALVLLGGLTLVSSPAQARTDATAATSSHSRLIPADEARMAAERAGAFWTPARMRAATEQAAPASGRAPSNMVQAQVQAARPNGKMGQVGPVRPKAAAQQASHVNVTPSVQSSAIGLMSVTDGRPWTGAGLPTTAIGRAFYLDDVGDLKYCTAMSLRSDGGNALLTAGHCVINASNGHWFNWDYQYNHWGNWIFVPGYNNGNAPYGEWYAHQLWVVPDYVNTQGNYKYDIGAAVMDSNLSGQHLQDVVGAEGAQWNWPLEQDVTAFGYPRDGSPSFNGEVLIYCQGRTYTDQYAVETLDCNQGSGASGGPMLARFDGSFGFADSMMTYGPSPTYGAYFGDDMGTLWANIRYL